MVREERSLQSWNLRSGGLLFKCTQYRDYLHPQKSTGEGGSTGRFFGDVESSKVADSPMLAANATPRGERVGGGSLQDWFAHSTCTGTFAFVCSRSPISSVSSSRGCCCRFHYPLAVGIKLLRALTPSQSGPVRHTLTFRPKPVDLHAALIFAKGVLPKDEPAVLLTVREIRDQISLNPDSVQLQLIGKFEN